MNLIKTSLLNGIAVAVKMLTMLSLNKVLAVYVGPAGYATIGQLQNAITMITTLASGAINNGVIKYTAEYFKEEERQVRVWCTAGYISLASSLITSILIAVFSNSLATFFLKDENYSVVFNWLSVTLTLFVFNSLMLAILNGKKEIGLYVSSNIGNSVFALIFTIALVIFNGLYGALVSLATYQSVAFFITLFICYRTKWFRMIKLFGCFDKIIAMNLAKYTLMTFTSATCVPLSHIIVRNHLGDMLGWKAAGYWDAMWRLSSAYFVLATTTIGFYYLPRLSELKDATEIKNEILQGYRIILPIAVLSGLVLYTLRDFFIEILFTKEFIPMRELFAWQIIGDITKLGGWILGYLIVGKAMFKVFIVTEIVFSLLFVLLSFLFIKLVGLEGVTLAHAVNYFFYWATLGVFIFIKLNRGI